MAIDQGISPCEPVKRIGMVIGVKPEKLALYKELHAPDNPGVRDLLIHYNIRNFSIFLQRLDDGKDYLFACYEYTGDDYVGDLARLGAESRNQAWLALCTPCQIPLEGQTAWTVMEEVYYNR
jgi:L-rhamnose mutarotase